MILFSKERLYENEKIFKLLLDMAYLKIGNHPKHQENPFIEKAIDEIEFKKKTQVVHSGNRSVIQHIVNDNGEPSGHTAFLRYVEVDDEQFAKVFLSQFAAFWDLTKPAIRVFGYILNQLKPDSDRFIFKMPEALKYTKYSTEASVFSGLSNLIECGMIARSTYDFEYFINPLVVFNGSRVTFAKTYVRKKKNEDPNQYKLFRNDMENQHKKLKKLCETDSSSAGKQLDRDSAVR